MATPPPDPQEQGDSALLIDTSFTPTPQPSTSPTHHPSTTSRSPANSQQQSQQQDLPTPPPLFAPSPITPTVNFSPQEEDPDSVLVQLASMGFELDLAEVAVAVSLADRDSTVEAHQEQPALTQSLFEAALAWCLERQGGGADEPRGIVYSPVPSPKPSRPPPPTARPVRGILKPSPVLPPRPPNAFSNFNNSFFKKDWLAKQVDSAANVFNITLSRIRTGGKGPVAGSSSAGSSSNSSSGGGGAGDDLLKSEANAIPYQPGILTNNNEVENDGGFFLPNDIASSAPSSAFVINSSNDSLASLASDTTTSTTNITTKNSTNNKNTLSTLPRSLSSSLSSLQLGPGGSPLPPKPPLQTLPKRVRFSFPDITIDPEEVPDSDGSSQCYGANSTAVGPDKMLPYDDEDREVEAGGGADGTGGWYYDGGGGEGGEGAGVMEAMNSGGDGTSGKSTKMYKSSSTGEGGSSGTDNNSAKAVEGTGGDIPAVDDLYQYYYQACAYRGEEPIEKLVAQLQSAFDRGEKLASLDLSAVVIDKRNVGSLADLFVVDFALKKLRLDNTALEDEVLKIILHAILTCNSLPWLSLANNRRLKTNGMKYIAVFVKKSKTLRYIDVSGIQFDKRAVSYLGHALGHQFSHQQQQVDDGDDGSGIGGGGTATGGKLETLRMDNCRLKFGLLEPL
ncbi:hypothetical protein HK102_012875, partial [Quaeritorhiza haematococci]